MNLKKTVHENQKCTVLKEDGLNKQRQSQTIEHGLKLDRHCPVHAHNLRTVHENSEDGAWVWRRRCMNFRNAPSIKIKPSNHQAINQSQSQNQSQCQCQKTVHGNPMTVHEKYKRRCMNFKNAPSIKVKVKIENKQRQSQTYLSNVKITPIAGQLSADQGVEMSIYALTSFLRMN